MIDARYGKVFTSVPEVVPKLAKVLITRQNYVDLVGIVKELHDRGASQIQLLYADDGPDIAEAEPFIFKAKQKGKKLGVEFLSNDFPFDKPIDLETDFSEVMPCYINEKQKAKVSVIITTSNRKDLLLKVLDSFREQTNSFEVIIVDDNSSDRTLEAVKLEEYDFRLVYLYWKREKEFQRGTPYNRAGPARNLGASHAQGTYLIFIDGDNVVSRNFIEEHLKSLKSGGLVIAPSIREKEGTDPREKLFTLANGNVESLPTPWSLVHSSNFSILKSDFETLGGFDGDFIYWGTEDQEFGYRVYKHGLKVVLNENARSIHLFHSPEYVNKVKMTKGTKYNATLFYKKHLDRQIFEHHRASFVSQDNETKQTIKLTDKCNNHCDFCAIVHPESKAQIISGRKYILTGEPTLSKDFFGFLDELKRKNATAELCTNARAFSYPGFAQKVYKYGIKNFLVRIYGYKPQIHDKITNVQGSFEQTKQGIMNLQELGANAVAYFVFDHRNFMYLDDMLRFCKKLGIRKFHTTVIEPNQDKYFGQFEFVKFTRKLLRTEVKLQNDIFRCFETEIVMDTEQMEKCLECSILQVCKGRPQELINGKKKVFFRDDDIGNLTPKLKKLIDIFIKHKVPLNLAVIPTLLTDETAQYLKSVMKKNPNLIDIHQHGYSHANHGNKYEFGKNRDLKTQLADIQKGQEIMGKYFNITPVFTPPFNAYDKNTLKALENLRFKAISTGNRVRGNLLDFSINTDMIETYDPLVFKSEEQIKSRFDDLDNVGLMIHHDFLEKKQFEFLDRFLGTLKSNPTVTFQTFKQMLAPKIFLIQPKFPNETAVVCEPTGLMILAAYLREFGYSVKIFDMNLSTDTSLIEKFMDFRPKFVGFAAVTPQINNAYMTSKMLKKKFPDIKVFFGGVHPTFLFEEAIENGLADFVVIGEGEETIKELIETLEAGKNPSIVKGIVYKSNNRIVNTGKRDFICDLDKLPLPAYDLVPIGMYKTSDCMIPGVSKPAVHILTSRGCPRNCDYCASPQLYNRRVRYRSIDNVMEELTLLKKFGIDWIHFHDDNLMLDQKRLGKLCERLVDFGIEWTCLADVRAVVDCRDVLSDMKKAGCIGIELGIESGDPNVFRSMNKIQDIRDIKLAVNSLKEHEIKILFLMMAYNIGETLETPYLSMKLLHELMIGPVKGAIPDFDKSKILIMGHLTRPSPGSSFYEMADKSGLVLAKTWDDHFEENITFIPNSFLDDTPKQLTEFKIPEIDYYIDSIFYTSDYIIKNVDEFKNTMKKVYDNCDGRTVAQIIDNLDYDKRLTVSALSMLSIKRMVGSK